MGIRVLLVGDRHNMQAELVQQLKNEGDIQVIGTADNGRQALALAREAAPDVLVVNLTPPDCRCLSLASRVRKQYPAVQLLVMSLAFNESSLIECLKAGVMGYLMKDRAFDNLAAGIRAVSVKRPYFCADALEVMMKRCRSDLSNKKSFG